MKKYIHYFFITALLVSLIACQTENEFPPEPEISFLNFQTFGSDSAHFTFSFTDGDGDLGLSDSDTSGDFEHNVYFNYIEIVNGSLDTFDFGDNAFNFRIPELHDGPDDKAVSGEITITLTPPYNVISVADTFYGRCMSTTFQ